MKITQQPDRQQARVIRRRVRNLISLASALLLLPAVAATGAQARGLAAPRLATPANDVSVQQLPALTWGAVRGAATYEYQVSGDPRFRSIVLGSGTGKGASRTYDLAAALDKTVSDGTYYWRVRALSAKDSVGPWSSVRRIFKGWTIAPQLTAGNGWNVVWPANPLILRWSAVPYATKYIVTVATDPALSNVVLGTTAQPIKTQGLNFALPSSLAEGVYFWAVTPLDAEGHPGTRSVVGNFLWMWPSSTTTSVTDLNPDPRVFDPFFSWNPVPGAARYEVEVNAAEGFPPGSRWCCSGTTTGTSLAPLQVLANNTYYWRVRAFDARGDAGGWNYGQPFSKAFDSVTPSIPNLTMRDVNGNALEGAPATSAPLVTWDPVPGASRYEVQLGVYNSAEQYCDWTGAQSPGFHADTATTAWTPLAQTLYRPYPESWPVAEQERAIPTGPNARYCVRVLATSDNDAFNGQVTSEWTYLNGYGNPAFTFTTPQTGSGCPVTPPSAYRVPASGSSTTRTPFLTWEPLPGAGSYYVAIARDAGFTHVVDVGFTDVNVYAPRLTSSTPLSDETTSYYWSVIPATQPGGAGACSDALHDNPQSFNKNSVPPGPETPAPGEEVFSQPTFRWSSVENARTYHLQVSQDPTFGKPIDDITTDATAYTSSSTYPADTTIYWRVRGNDWNGQGLNWSPTQTFVRRLPAPAPTSNLSGGGVASTPLTWTAVQGAVAYDVHINQPDGRTTESSVEAPSGSITEYYGTGFGSWQVRAEFPTGAGSKVPGAFSALQPILLTLPPPSGAVGVRTGGRTLVTWSPEAEATKYQVEISSTNGFNSRIESHVVDGTSWAPNLNPSVKSNRGTLYWRVAAVDSRGQPGSYASGTFGFARASCARSPKHGKHGGSSGACRKRAARKHKRHH